MLLDILLDDTAKYFKTFTILYVENEDSNIKATVDIFYDLFKDVSIAKNGLLGLELYKQYFNDTGNYFDMIITDIHMPKLDGIGMVEAIYNINKSQKVVVLSAYENKEYFIPLINMGVDGFIQKPLSLESIFDVLNHIYTSYKDNEISLIDGYSFKSNTLFKDNQKIELTKNEIKLLGLFLRNSSRYLSLDDIYTHIFYDEPSKDFSSDSIRGYIKRLKTKLPNNLIVNNRTLGYKFNLTN